LEILGREPPHVRRAIEDMSYTFTGRRARGVRHMAKMFCDTLAFNGNIVH